MTMDNSQAMEIGDTGRMENGANPDMQSGGMD
jgi:hypothetical protein